MFHNPLDIAGASDAEQRQHTGAMLMLSRVGYAFDQYQRERDGRRPLDLSALRTPSEPGLVSVILPTFNGERFLAAAIDSILAQSYRQLELIVIDDGSTDSTSDILARYAAADPRLRLIRQLNRGLPAALNAGYALARGQFLTWTSDDNLLGSEFLAQMVEALRRDPRAEMIYADYELIDEQGAPSHNSLFCERLQHPPGSGRLHLPRDVSMLNLVNGNYIGSAFLYRDRARLLIGDYNPRHTTCEDYDFFLRVNERLTLRHAGLTDTGIYRYREHGASLSARREDLRIAERTERLLRTDAFRRDLTFAPVAWLGPEASFLRPLLLRSGDCWLDPSARDLNLLPPHGLALVHLHATDRPAAAAAPAADLPAWAFQVLIDTGAAPLPASVDPAWHCCMTLQSGAALPPLDGDRRGWLSCPDSATLARAIRIRILSDHLARLESFIDEQQATPDLFDVSVIICTNGRRPTLEQALAAACRQTLTADRYEIILVANAPVRDLAPLVAEASTHFQNIRQVLCPPPGLSLARNAGLAEARGRIVVYLDDDAIAEPDLLERLLATYAEHPDAGVVGGAILVEPPAPRPWWWGEATARYWADLNPPATLAAAPGDWRAFPYGANWSARRADLLEVGGFRVRYGRGGRAADSGEEIVAAIDIQRLGRKVLIDPRARIRHLIEPTRFRLRSLWQMTIDNYRTRLRLEQDLLIPERARLTDNLWHGIKRIGRALAPSRAPIPERIEHLLTAAGCIWLSGAIAHMLSVRLLRRPRRPPKS